MKSSVTPITSRSRTGRVPGRDREAVAIRPVGGSPLFDRERALSLGREVLDGAVAGSGSTLAFTGGWGIGRSAVLECLRDRADRAGAGTSFARGAANEQELEFGVVLQLLGRFAPAPEAAELDSLFDGARPAARFLAEPRPLDDHGPGAERAGLALVHALHRLTSNLAARRPLLLFVDDVQWADEWSLRFLRYLTPRLAEQRVGLLVTMRDAEPAGAPGLLSELIGGENVGVHRLPTLGVDTVGRLVSEASRTPAPELATRCHRLTGGNPLLLGDVLALAGRAGRRGNRLAAAPSRAFVSDRLCNRLHAELSRMAPGALAVAEAVATLGPDAERGRVVAITGLGEDEPSAATESLQSAGVLDPRHRYRFVHPLIGAAVRRHMSAGEVSRTHASAAGLLRADDDTGERVGGHLLRCEPAGRSWVAGDLRRAASNARSRGDLGLAGTFLRRALSEPPDPAEREGILIELGQTQIDEGRSDAAIATLTRAAGNDHRTARRPAIALELSRAMSMRGDLGAAAEVLDGAIAACDARNKTLRAELRAAWLTTALAEPKLRSEAGSRIAQIDVAAEESASPVLLGVVACHLAMTGQDCTQAAQLATRALEYGHAPDDSTRWGPALQALIWTGEIAAARRAAARISSQLPVQSSHHGLAAAGLVTAQCAHMEGALREAEEEARFAAVLASGHGDQRLETAERQLALVLLARGQTTAAERVLEAAPVQSVRETSMAGVGLLLARSAVAAARLDHEAALTNATDAGDLLVAAGVENPTVAAWRSQAGLAVAALGDPARARSLISDELEIARDVGIVTTVGVTLRRAAKVSARSEAIAQLLESERMLQDSGARLEHARSLADLGVAYRKHGSQKRARAVLKQALDAAARLGVAPLARFAHAELRLAGARPRLRASSGVEGLTIAERRVADLAIAGRTNREISEQLFVTKKTVEWHLHNAFRKLEIGSRAELQSALKRIEPAG